ncbi:MAG: Rieske (2Fe-2S) protein [Deltaproteobacteria bacterium]|nr:MAG: Rieske (2Fe-2S) protein [Deltaproteobacteria bacterium]
MDETDETPDVRPSGEAPVDRSRRTALGRIATAGAATLVAGSYAGFAAVALRYLDPPRRTPRRIFAGRIADLDGAGALVLSLPGGDAAMLVRSHDERGVVAFSNVCPHLGCRVHYEGANERFFCPCHNGVFELDGTAVEGPPAKAGQRLTEFPVDVRDGLIFLRLDHEPLPTVPASALSRRRRSTT